MLIRPAEETPGNNHIWILSLFAILTAILLAPVFFSSYRFDSWLTVIEFGLASLVTAGFFTALRQISFHLRLLSVMFWVLLAVVFVIRLSWFLVLDFSGEGFTNNFYAHISIEAMYVAGREYMFTLLAASMLFALSCVAIVLLKRKPVVKPGSALVSVTVAFLLLVFNPYFSTEKQLLLNYLTFHDAMKPARLSAKDLLDLEQSGLVNIGNNEKSKIIAKSGPDGRNLILVYLESFHLAFTDDGPLKDLTPDLNRLKREHGYHSNWLSSADGTMEAIIGTQCGTLVSTPQGGNTFANTHSILPRLACLPDVLHEAGYYQVFLGGFDKNFSGKNLFLTGHGYDKVIGWEDWQQLGFNNNDGYWGLPDDVLFEQALVRIRELTSKSASQPFNLTMLTLSTHPPGFSSSSCKPYAANPDDSRLLEAIHCTDQIVGKFVSQLQSEQLLENTTLVITGDHDIFNLPEVRAHFPDLARDPRLLNIIIDPDEPFSYPEQVNVAYDLAPTLLDLLQVDHDTQFIWGISVFDQRESHVSRRFRGANTASLDFHVSADRDCLTQQETLSIPLDDCEHNRLLNLSDRYLSEFYDESLGQTELCSAEQNLQIEVGSGEGPVSIRFLGVDLANSFAHNGRPLNPTSPGFYLFIKPSLSRTAAYYYFGLEHIYWQMKLVDTLMDLNSTDQFVLVYKPEVGIEVIEPLEQLMHVYGFSEQNLEQPFLVTANGNPNRDQIFRDQGEPSAKLKVSLEDCILINSVEKKDSVLDKTVIDALLAPYKLKYPDI